MRLLLTLALCAPTLAIATTVSAETFKADVPDSLITPDVVETTRLGTLRFTDGLPDADTVQKLLSMSQVASTSVRDRSL